MKSGVTFAAVCLLALSGCERKAQAPEGEATAEWVTFAPEVSDASDGSDATLATDVSEVVSALLDPVESDKDGVPDQAGSLELVAEAKYRAAQVILDGAQVRADVENLSDLVNKKRFARLHAYALRARWHPNVPPLVTDPEVEGWWLEWRELRDRDLQQRMATLPAFQFEATGEAAAPLDEPEVSAP